MWLRDGRRVAVRIPPGCLLMQAGKQLEWLTGGYITAGLHEVRGHKLGRERRNALWGVRSLVDMWVGSPAVFGDLGEPLWGQCGTSPGHHSGASRGLVWGGAAAHHHRLREMMMGEAGRRSA